MARSNVEGSIPATRFDLDHTPQSSRARQENFCLLTETYHGTRATGNVGASTCLSQKLVGPPGLEPGLQV